MSDEKKNMKSVKNKEARNWMSEADNQYNRVEWFGAIFQFSLGDKSKGFEFYYSKEKRKSNVIIGYFLQLFFLILIIYLLYKLTLR